VLSFCDIAGRMHDEARVSSDVTVTCEKRELHFVSLFVDEGVESVTRFPQTPNRRLSFRTRLASTTTAPQR
jgi:hypothetical protein